MEFQKSRLELIQLCSRAQRRNNSIAQHTDRRSVSRFHGAIYKAACGAIPRGHRPVYTSCLDSECAALLREYESSGDPDIGDHLIESLNAARCARWEKNTAGLDFTHSSWKSWNLIRRLGAAQQPPSQSHPLVTPNQVARSPTEGSEGANGEERQTAGS